MGYFAKRQQQRDTEQAARTRAVAVSEWKSVDKKWATAEAALARVLAGDPDDQIGWSYGTLKPRRPEQGLNLIRVVLIVTFGRVSAYRMEGERELLAEWRFTPDISVTIEGDHRLVFDVPDDPMSSFITVDTGSDATFAVWVATHARDLGYSEALRDVRTQWAEHRAAHPDGALPAAGPTVTNRMAGNTPAPPPKQGIPAKRR